MSKYERQPVDVASLQEGDVFELPKQPGSVCKVSYHNLREEENGQQIGIIGYSILEGNLHWPVIYLPPNFQIMLLLPTTTHVHLSGKDWVQGLTEHHGVKS
jgi:hypothetical protein